MYILIDIRSLQSHLIHLIRFKRTMFLLGRAVVFRGAQKNTFYSGSAMHTFTMIISVQYVTHATAVRVCTVWVSACSWLTDGAVWCLTWELHYRHNPSHLCLTVILRCHFSPSIKAKCSNNNSKRAMCMLAFSRADLCLWWKQPLPMFIKCLSSISVIQCAPEDKPFIVWHLAFSQSELMSFCRGRSEPGRF